MASSRAPSPFRPGDCLCARHLRPQPPRRPSRRWPSSCHAPRG
uniref:Uncharacterized protein n=1 Tax=Setaria italica TaxID=4555 RepID=K4APH5_SETIT